MVTLLIYSDLISSPVDKTDADVDLDYSKLKADIKSSIESNNFMLPSIVEQRLIEIWREAIGASGLANKKRKMFNMRNNAMNRNPARDSPKKKKKTEKDFKPPKGKGFTKSAKCCFKCRRLGSITKKRMDFTVGMKLK